VERRIGQSASAGEIAEAAKASGMRDLWQSGLAHVLKGESTIDELLRVVDVPQEDEFRKAAAAPTTSPPHETATPAPATPAPPPRAAPAISDTFELLEAAVVEDDVETTPTRDQRHGRVLLVDDEDQLRRVMRDLLERDGYTVTEARDGIEALDQVDRTAPDIIVLDLNLPGLDGYGVLSHLRSRRSTENIPVVVLTARGDEENEVRVFEFGADDFLSKPFRARALSARLDAVLRRTRKG
jgi:CheY-like chemotaxis protein